MHSGTFPADQDLFRQRTGLKGIDLNVEAGDFYALLGTNGAGKSTTIGIICSLVNKTAGSVRVFGYDLEN
nr:Hypoxanthine phosphoribosyltransferase [Candidatus Pantoea persica]